MKLVVENKDVLLVKKPVGKTPYQMVQALRRLRPELLGEKVGYAGRLDPMAEGLLILLIGEENKKRKLHEALSKTYDFTLLHGVATDTYDILGKITSAKRSSLVAKNIIEKYALEFVGRQIVEYPPYSSAVFRGKPLYYWARKGKLDTVKIPKREIEIFSLEIKKIRSMSVLELKRFVTTRINSVEGDFRQKEILLGWEKFLRERTQDFQVVDLKMTCSSGTYVRSLCSELAKKLGTVGIALSINRTQVGDYKLKDALSVKM